jgi:hypothetical protein
MSAFGKAKVVGDLSGAVRTGAALECTQERTGKHTAVEVCFCYIKMKRITES